MVFLPRIVLVVKQFLNKNNMNNKSKLVFFVLMLLLPNLVTAQINFGIHANFGFSKFIEKNREPAVVVGNYYTTLPSFSIGLDALYSFNNTKFGFITGMNISSFASENNMPDDFDDPSYTGARSWDERFYTLSLPLKVNYKFEEWVHINAGLSNTLILNEPKEIFIQKINKYTLNFTGGVDFIIKQRFLIGATYYRDILPTMIRLKDKSNPETYDIKYSIEQITLKIGFKLTK